MVAKTLIYETWLDDQPKRAEIRPITGRVVHLAGSAMVTVRRVKCEKSSMPGRERLNECIMGKPYPTAVGLCIALRKTASPVQAAAKLRRRTENARNTKGTSARREIVTECCLDHCFLHVDGIHAFTALGDGWVGWVAKMLGSVYVLGWAFST